MHEDNAVRARLIGEARAEFLRRYEERVFPGLGHGRCCSGTRRVWSG